MRDANICAAHLHDTLDFLRMNAAATVVDVHAIWFVMRDGNIRAQLDAGPITYAEVFATQAYDHPLARMQLTGRELASVFARCRTTESAFWSSGSIVARRA